MARQRAGDSARRGPAAARGGCRAGGRDAGAWLLSLLALAGGARALPAESGGCPGLARGPCGRGEGCVFLSGWGCLNKKDAGGVCAEHFYKKTCGKVGCKWKGGKRNGMCGDVDTTTQATAEREGALGHVLDTSETF